MQVPFSYLSTPVTAAVKCSPPQPWRAVASTSNFGKGMVHMSLSSPNVFYIVQKWSNVVHMDPSSIWYRLSDLVLLSNTQCVCHHVHGDLNLFAGCGTRTQSSLVQLTITRSSAVISIRHWLRCINFSLTLFVASRSILVQLHCFMYWKKLNLPCFLTSSILLGWECRQRRSTWKPSHWCIHASWRVRYAIPGRFFPKYYFPSIWIWKFQNSLVIFPNFQQRIMQWQPDRVVLLFRFISFPFLTVDVL
jgi:hypothetical protein